MTLESQQLLAQASALHRQGKFDAAIATYQRLLAATPALPDCWFDLAWLLRTRGDAEAALSAYAQALSHGVRGPEEVHLNRAVIYTDLLRRDNAAEAELHAALALAPDYPPALLNLGNLREEQGRREEAMENYRRLLATLPESGTAAHQGLRPQALARLAHLVAPQSQDDPLLAQLERAAARPGIDDDTRATAWFALGRARDALQRHDSAFAAFAAGNAAAARAAPAYDRQQARQQTRSMIEVFGQAAPPEVAGPLAAAMPVFICGMFRSGSTLLEQALSAHPRVQAGGEVDFLPRLVTTTLAPFPESARKLSTANTQAIAQAYQATLERQFPQALGEGRLITDKRPDNYRLIGLIKRLFPAARFVHTVRDPRDIGLSVYMHHLDPRQLPYACRLSDIGHHIGQYRELMAHWRALHGDSIIEFDYDLFVRAPRATLEPVLRFLGLDWHDGCLDFHLQQNSVKTASFWQVRRPLYGDASGRWRQYRSHLQPLLAALQEAGIALPD